MVRLRCASDQRGERDEPVHDAGPRGCVLGKLEERPRIVYVGDGDNEARRATRVMRITETNDISGTELSHDTTRRRS